MREITKWITINGQHIPIFKEKNTKFNKKPQFNYKQEGSNGKYKLSALKNNEVVGFIRYNDEGNTPSVVFIRVDNKYRHKGIAKELYRKLQKQYPNKTIKFGEMTEEGRQLIEHIGKITKQIKNSDGFIEYYGRINI